MRTRTPVLLLIFTALVLGSIGSLVAVAANHGTAHACSIAAPWAEVNPTRNLQPGQQIEIVGYGYSDVIWHDTPAPTDPDEPAIALCDFDLIPQQGVEIVWQGSGSPAEVLAVVSGPDFKTTVRVPVTATAGKASVVVGGHVIGVSVLDDHTVPPDPCPLTLQPDGTVQHWCPEPEPWPCPLYGAAQTQAGQTQLAPGVDVAPGFLPPCPEPCVDYLHTTDDGTTYDYKWDCPDPCGYPQAAPGAPADTNQVWCPPPDPCNWVGGDARVCPDPCAAYGHAGDEALSFCPDPCPAYGHAGDEALSFCPDPCLGLDAEAADFAPCPDPCYVVGGDAWVCPEPCPVYAQQDLAVAPCPDPCGYDDGVEAVWCPPALPATTAVSAVAPAAETEPAIEALGEPEQAAPAADVSTGQAAPTTTSPQLARDSEEPIEKPPATTIEKPPAAVLPTPASPPAAIETRPTVARDRAATHLSLRVVRSASAILAVLFG